MIFWTIISLELAAYEGSGYFWSSLSRNDQFQQRSFNSFLDTAWLNLENGEYGQSGLIANFTAGTANTLGKKNEVAVAGMLWDVYDSNPDDYSDSTNWGDTVLPHNSGNFAWDTLSLGVVEILETLFRNTGAGHKPDNINDFWEAWFLSPSYGHLRGMMDIWHEHGACCVGMSGDINWDGSDADILDQTYLIDRIFRGGAPPPCPLEADLNGDGTSANALDLTYIIDYIFRGGADPVDCP